MKKISRRRIKYFLLLIAAAAVFQWLHRLHGLSLRDPSFFSGWTLIALLTVLILFNSRKKVPFLPLGSASTWAQVHFYSGLLSLWVFGFHIGWKLPAGWFEWALGALFFMSSASGVLGLILLRILPPRISRRGEPVLFERIEGQQMEIKNRVESLVKKSMSQTQSNTIAEFYRGRLMAFLKPADHFWRQLFESRTPLHNLIKELDNLDRYLDDRERRIMAEIRDLVMVKDELDYQYAAQALLKRWLFVHVPLSYGLICFVVVHVVVVHAFHGGA